MRCFRPLFLFMVTCAWSQTQAPEVIAITDSTVIATVNGQKFTAGDLARITQNLSPEHRRMAGLEPQKFLEDYALALTLQNEANKAGLAAKSPWREQIERATRDILINAVMTEKKNQIPVPAEQLKKVWNEKQADFRQATAKVIFVSRMGFAQDLSGKSKQTITPEEAKAKAADLAKQARDGRDFAALAREHSDDRRSAGKNGDFPYPIRAGDNKVPKEIRDALMAAKPGDIVGPIEHGTGYYIFRVESVDQQSFESAKANIETEIRTAAVNNWLEELRKKSTATLDHEIFWKTYLVANKEALEHQAAAGDAK